MERPLHRVTCKVALYDRAKQSVLITENRPNEFGLPGGHLEQNEEPEMTLRREIGEELGIKYDKPLTRKDFWIHNDGKVILGFVGELDSSTKLKIDKNEIRSATWVAVDDIKNGKISAGTYDYFILSNSDIKTFIVARAVVYDSINKSILLVRKADAPYWHAPGGGLDDGEDIKECAKREVLEEAGLEVEIKRLLYVQELHDKGSRINFEFFWLAEPSNNNQILDENHVDTDTDDGIVEARWFTKEQIQSITVYPEKLKDTFWDNIEMISSHEDSFIGIFK
jgi:8-oxo-dGTP pyrophosphatase MutT (NUDIX family)